MSQTTPGIAIDKSRIQSMIESSNLISRDLSWLKFNQRVLDQARKTNRTILERLKFMAITGSNLDEFFMIRVGSLYNYLDYGKERIDYSGLRERPFKKLLFEKVHEFAEEQKQYFKNELVPLFRENNFLIARIGELNEDERKKARDYFVNTIFPMLTPMVYDSYHPFPLLVNLTQIFGVVTLTNDKPNRKKISFILVPQNIPKFFEIERNDERIFIPVSEVIKDNMDKLFRNIRILSINLFRITRNGDFTVEESDDLEANFIEELNSKLKTRKTGRVVRIEIEEGFDESLMALLKKRWELDDENIFIVRNDDLMDFTALWQIVNHRDFKDRLPVQPKQVPPLLYPEDTTDDIFEVLKARDIMLHHPYNSIEPLLELIENAAEDPSVLSIKLTVYRIAKHSRITSALLKAAENGKHVSVLFELKARFDEENNLNEAKRLQQAGCFVIYGISNVKTHTKLLLIVRKEGEKVTRYVHMSSGNYNEITAKLYTDIGILTTDESYGKDVSEFFNAITGHSLPSNYELLITAPKDMRHQIIDLIRGEADHARKGLPAGIVIKINSLQDKHVIKELYDASVAGVKIKLIVRGMCCLRPGRKDLSENIQVISIVGDYLEHSRLYYFHNNGNPKVYGGSADVMVRSFERRIESLFLIKNELVRKQAINILKCNMKDNMNSYNMNEDGTYTPRFPNGEPPFDLHREFYKVKLDEVKKAVLF
ncbi:MAG TPA: polyphosphate kinase 1 [Cyclobacteriaceae bacterium]|nr:polyphosphate kinase 1 [Cyclobacteriaceae bacterium]